MDFPGHEVTMRDVGHLPGESPVQSVSGASAHGHVHRGKVTEVISPILVVATTSSHLLANWQKLPPLYRSINHEKE